jgi:ABC-2 type transport system ATP-binding protein
MLQAKNLTKKYGEHTALNSLNLTIEAGEVFCLLGQNGAGKTTTINLFMGFAEPTEGVASVNGLDVATHPIESKKYIAYIPETVMLYPNLTGIENLEFFSSLAGFKYSKTELSALLDRAGLQQVAHNQRVSGYSKGMRQKVGIAIALAKQAKALLLDEPTSGLDPKASNEFSTLIKDLATEGVAILMATHDIFRAKDVASRVGIMRAGNLVAVHQAKDFSAAELENIYLETV